MSESIEVNLKFKNRLSIYEFGAFVNDAVESCFSYDEALHTEVYDPTFLDFKMKSLFVTYYSNYKEVMEEKLMELYEGDTEKVESELYNIDVLYDFCCDIKMNNEYFEKIGVDFDQYVRIATAVEDRISHKVRMIENRAGFNEILNKANEVSNTINEIVKAFIDGINEVDINSILNEYKATLTPQNIVAEYMKSSMAKNNQKEVEEARKQRNKDKNNANVIPVTNYKDTGDKN